MNRYRILAVLLVVLLVVPTGASAVQGEPNLSASLPENRVTPGQETTVSVQVMNTGDLEVGGPQPSNEQRVLTARGVSVSMRTGNAPIEVRTTTRLIGSVSDGEVRSVPFRIAVDEGAEPGTYRVPVRVSYKYTDQIVESLNFRDDEEATERLYVTLKVTDEARFRVVNTSTDAQIGAEGDVSMTLRNVGSAAANASRITVQSGTSELQIGNGGAVSRFVGDWEPNETRTVEVSATTAESAETRSYTVAAEVAYEDEDGVTTVSETLTGGVTPLAEQSFAIENVRSTLRVDEEGELRGELVNAGPLAVENAVVVLESTAPTIQATETEVAVGDLGPGERATFEFSAEVTGEAEPGSRQLTMRVRYRQRGDRYRSDSIDVRTAIEEEQPVFSVEAVEARFTPGGSGVVKVRVTNARESPVTDVSAKLYAQAPLSSGDDEAFVEELGPGESRTVTFGLGVGGGALAEKTYPVKVDFRYDDDAGETHITDTYQVPVQVIEPADTGPSPVLIGGLVVLVVLLVGGGIYYWRR